MNQSPKPNNNEDWKENLSYTKMWEQLNDEYWLIDMSQKTRDFIKF